MKFHISLFAGVICPPQKKKRSGLCCCDLCRCGYPLPLCAEETTALAFQNQSVVVRQEFRNQPFLIQHHPSTLVASAEGVVTASHANDIPKTFLPTLSQNLLEGQTFFSPFYSILPSFPVSYGISSDMATRRVGRIEGITASPKFP